MKKMLLWGLTLGLAFSATAQNHSDVLSDSARMVVDRFVQMLNIDGLPQDSLLVMETAITTNLNSKDTVWMHRWYAPGERHRLEVWEEGKMTYGMVTNGKDRFRRYVRRGAYWESIHREEFFKSLRGYDFRGPLYRWADMGAQLSWNGRTELKGQPLQVVKVECPDMYSRYYMFEPESGLLTLIFETDENPYKSENIEASHIEWKSMHEYQPTTTSILPSLESFMRNGVLTILRTTYRFEPLDNTFFEHD